MIIDIQIFGCFRNIVSLILASLLWWLCTSSVLRRFQYVWSVHVLEFVACLQQHISAHNNQIGFPGIEFQLTVVAPKLSIRPLYSSGENKAEAPAEDSLECFHCNHTCQFSNNLHDVKIKAYLLNLSSKPLNVVFCAYIYEFTSQEMTKREAKAGILVVKMIYFKSFLC